MKSKIPMILGSLLFCALLVSGLLFALHSTRTVDAEPAASNAPELVLSKEIASPGENVSVAVDLSQNPGLMVMMFRINYDRSRLSLTGATGVGLSGWDLRGDKLLWLGNADSDYNGTILRLNFRVAENAEPGSADVTLSCKRGDVGNHDEESFLPIITPGRVTVEAGTVAGSQDPLLPNPGGLPFTDVYASGYYYDAVVWAYRNGITNGRGSDTFAPEGTCTRAETVTFLWRAAGCPEPALTDNPFTDIKTTDYCCKAVLWAYENGITRGTGAARFSPRGICSTAQVVTFVYRAKEVGSDGWYREAGDWASGAGLLSDTGLLVDPHENCPRSAIVTILYRWSQSH